MTELLPCPMCGKRPDMKLFAGEWFVGCQHLDLVGSTHRVVVSAFEQDEAIKVWNKRWTDDRLEDDLK